MPLPKFWEDTGSNNDLIVQCSILIALIGWMLLSYLIRSPALGIASLLLGPITGFIAGLGIVAFLCTYCRKLPKTTDETPRP